MSNIFVNEEVKELGLKEGDILFYRPEEDLYEWSRSDSLKREGLVYTVTESTKIDKMYLQELIDVGILKEWETVEEEYDYEEPIKESGWEVNKMNPTIYVDWFDREKFIAEKKWRIAQERELVPIYLWHTLNLTNLY